MLQEYYAGKIISDTRLLRDKILSHTPGNEEILVPTVAGTLFFSHHPHNFIPEAQVICTRFTGTEGRDIIQSEEITGTLIEQADLSLRLVKSWVLKSYKLSGAKLSTKMIVPEEALREAINNALLHRKYTIPGSTKIALYDNRTILSLKMPPKNISFDELPCIGATIDDIDAPLIQESFASIIGGTNKSKYESLGIMTRHHGKTHVSNGGILLFSKNRFQWFPDSQITCICFADESRSEIVDQKEFTTPLSIVLDEIIEFIKRNTRTKMTIDKLRREERPQYPFRAIREALINAIIHADYSLQGVSTQIAIFTNRIEITNPGVLVYGQTMELALSGISSMRNKMMGRIFREIKLIERLGTGIGRIINEYRDSATEQPLFEELNTHFRVTLYSPDVKQKNLEDWQKKLVNALTGGKHLSTIEIADLWAVTTRTARTRLRKMIEMNLIHRLGTSPKDPKAVFKLA